MFSAANSQGANAWANAGGYQGSNPLVGFTLEDVQGNGGETAYLLDVVSAGYKLYTGYQNRQDFQTDEFKAARSVLDSGGTATTLQLTQVAKTFANSFDRLNNVALIDGGIQGFQAYQGAQMRQNQQNLALYSMLAKGGVPKGGNQSQDWAYASMLQNRVQQQQSGVMMLLVVGGFYFLTKKDS